MLRLICALNALVKILTQEFRLLKSIKTFKINIFIKLITSKRSHFLLIEFFPLRSVFKFSSIQRQTETSFPCNFGDREGNVLSCVEMTSRDACVYALHQLLLDLDMYTHITIKSLFQNLTVSSYRTKGAIFFVFDQKNQQLYIVKGRI